MDSPNGNVSVTFAHRTDAVSCENFRIGSHAAITQRDERPGSGDNRLGIQSTDNHEDVEIMHLREPPAKFVVTILSCPVMPGPQRTLPGLSAWPGP